ncbi:uncharacterized protein LOC133785744 [Humulus lupulus]|uniref:uncharacterized protein LOC133785744 n=1 Tax=Humulus lupulus TaxID=3486 RepID=UPI002B410AD6|nr:uncharacterized protein LOC133785744 [Humulus lupulus]
MAKKKRVVRKSAPRLSEHESNSNQDNEKEDAGGVMSTDGANPPMAVFEGYIKRIWGHLGIAQIARMTMGLTMVKFNDEATRDLVLENGVLQFDRKPVIVRPWSSNLDAVKLIRSVPLWIRLHDLGLQYWGNKCLSALVSTVGKPIMVDQHTRDRTRIQFARVLVEMDITDAPPRLIKFLNEHGKTVDQSLLSAAWKTPKRAAGSRMKEPVPGPSTTHDQDVGNRSANKFSILQEEKGDVTEEVEGGETKGPGLIST